MTIEDADQVIDSATAYLRELCPAGMEFVLIIGTMDTDGSSTTRSVSYQTSLAPDRAFLAADMLREALEMAQGEDETQ
jgi:hypothetical protein